MVRRLRTDLGVRNGEFAPQREDVDNWEQSSKDGLRLGTIAVTCGSTREKVAVGTAGRHATVCHELVVKAVVFSFGTACFPLRLERECLPFPRLIKV